ncbi:MAG: HD domain-containing protein [Renibacterium sp.]|nr:HD domain-containing protein [Renibacterium sp.]
MTDFVQRIQALFDGEGSQDYLGEEVSMATHMLQSGALAQAAGAEDQVVVAALLHDIGHFTGAVSGAELMSGTDNDHDEAGAIWLSQWFDEPVLAPIRMHVDAKRYLCAVEPAYLSKLSEASRYTLAVQGGPMAESEIAAFEALPHFEAAVAVRRWDDAAKDPQLPTPEFSEFAGLLRRVAVRS